MIITRATEYSIRAVLCLAEHHSAGVVSKQEICAAAGVTPAFLTKILQPLIRGGIVRSKRGVAGGFRLARDPRDLTLLDVMRCSDEPMTLNVCLLSEHNCERSCNCAVHELWSEAKQSIESIFSRRSLADVAREQAQRADGSFPCAPSHS
jgi:Rrf2 family protein